MSSSTKNTTFFAKSVDTRRAAVIIEHRTQNTEHRTQNTEHRTQNTEHRTQALAVSSYISNGLHFTGKPLGFPRVSAAKSGGFFSFKFSSRLEAGGTSWERETPLLPKRGFPSPKPSPFPSTAWGFTPRPRSRRLPGMVSGFKNTFVASPAQFWLSKVLLLLARHDFGVQKYSHGLSGRNFSVREYSHGFPRAFSAFGSIPKRFPACFRVSKVLFRLSRRDFGLQKHFRCFPGAFSAFKSIFVASPTRFRASKVLLLLPRRSFGLQKHFFHSVKTKNHHTVRSFYGKGCESYQQRAHDGA